MLLICTTKTIVGLPNLFQNTGDPTIVLVVQINDMIALFTILFIFFCFRKIGPDSTGVIWLKMERLWYVVVKKSEVRKDVDSDNEYCITITNQTSAN